MKKFILAISLIFFLSGYSFAKIKITTTIKPLADIVKAVCKDDCEVSYIILPNISFHTYELKISDVKKIYDSDYFVFIGYGEPFLENIKKTVPLKKQIQITKIKGIFLIKNENADEDEKIHPALWLDPANAKVIAKYMKEKLKGKVDEKKLEKNYQIFEKKINNLLSEGKLKFNQLSKKDFISYHYLYPYFTNRFGLNYVAVIEKGHGKSPTIKHLLKLIKIIQERKIRSIFASIQFYNPKYTDFLTRQTGVKVILLDPFGIKTDYTGMMKTLIEKVYQGLKDG